MPDNQKAIADTSVLIAFEKLNKLDLLCLAYKEIFLPEAVYQEYASDLQNCFILKTAPEPISEFLINHVGLGRGESESIALAHSMGTRVLIDDLKARKIALDFGCRVTGTIGVLYKMEKKNHFFITPIFVALASGCFSRFLQAQPDVYCSPG